MTPDNGSSAGMCPTCNAQPGYPCASPMGLTMGRYHDDRPVVLTPEFCDACGSTENVVEPDQGCPPLCERCDDSITAHREGWDD